MTPGCTTEACDFRDSLGSLQGAGYTVLGVSRDLPAKLREFRERDGLVFPLLSDPDHAVHDAYGAWGERSEEHTSELQSLMRISYAVFCLKKKKKNNKSQQITRVQNYNNL